MGDIEQSFESLKYELEKQKLEFERKKYERESTFLNKNFGVIITALVSAATIVVSGSGILISSNYNASQLDNTKAQSEKNFAFDVAKFMLEKREEINTGDTLKASYARNIVIALFPDTLAAKITARMRDLSNDPDVKQVWADGATYAQTIASLPAPSLQPKRTITVESLAKTFDELADRTKQDQLKGLLAAAQANNISDKNDVAMFLTFVLHETNFLKETVENLNYSASRLLALYPSRFPTLAKATEYAGNPEKIANYIYAGRMGNLPNSEDGFKFRGRGYLMIAGRANYQEAGRVTGVDLESDPGLLLQPDVNARVAAYFFAKWTKAARQKGSLDLVSASRAIDGGIVGIDSKRAIFERIQRLLS